MGTLGIIERDGEQFVVIATIRVSSNGSKFDGRMKFTLRRVSDGKLFGWLGSRTSKRVPFNAKLTENIFQDA
jgi:hypothetical protein